MSEEIKKICLSDDKQQTFDSKDNDLDFDFSKFKLEGFEPDEELIKKFQPIAKKLNLSSDSQQALLELALEMSKKQRAVYIKDEQQKLDDDVKKYDSMFRDDPDLPNVNSSDISGYMQIANSAYCEFCSDKLREFFEKTGINYHPELIKMFHKIGELMKEDSIDYAGKPKYDELTPAQILYGER